MSKQLHPSKKTNHDDSPLEYDLTALRAKLTTLEFSLAAAKTCYEFNKQSFECSTALLIDTVSAKPPS